MSFIGTATIEKISSDVLRITGLSLPAGTEGVLGLSDASGSPTPDLLLPPSFRPEEFTFDGQTVPLVASVKVSVEPVTTGPLTNLPPSITKTGATSAGFRIAIKNTKVDLTTQELEIYVAFLRPARVQPSCSTTIVVNSGCGG